MGASEFDRIAARRHVGLAQAGLRGLNIAASPAGAEPTAGVMRGVVTAAMNELDGAVRLLTEPGEIARIGCRFCGRMIMPAATLCGFCWRTLSPATSG
jgi:hypothetical protein